MGGILTIVKPKIVAFKNTWFGKTEEPLARGVRIGTVLTAAIFIPYVIFIGIQQSISDLEGGASTLGAILEVINVTFLSVLFFSSCVHSLNTLFLANDNEMLLAAPIPPLRLYIGKFLETAFASSWVLLIFYIPAVWAIGASFQAGLLYFLFTLLYVVPMILIPCALSFIASILFVKFYPARRVREILILLSIIVVVGLHFGLKGQEIVRESISRDLASSLSSEEDLFKGLSSHFVHESMGLLSRPFELAAAGKTSYALQAVAAAFASALLALLASYSCFIDLYLKVFSLDSAQNARARGARSRKRWLIPKSLYYRIPHTWRAFASKDYRLFLRDLAQPVQLLLFLFMGFFAMMGFHASSDAAESMRAKYEWWDALIMMTNLGFHALLSILFAARFIFPSIAAEAEASWIIKCVPVAPKYYFRAKFIVTAFPSVLVLMSFLAAGCIMSSLPAFHLLFALSVGLLNTICIASISIGLGAYFANMRYEHFGQITTGLGSVLSMFICLLVLPADNIVALSFGVLVKQYNDALPDMTVFTLSYVLLALMHLCWMKYFIAKGRERWASL